MERLGYTDPFIGYRDVERLELGLQLLSRSLEQVSLITNPPGLDLQGTGFINIYGLFDSLLTKYQHCGSPNTGSGSGQEAASNTPSSQQGSCKGLKEDSGSDFRR